MVAYQTQKIAAFVDRISFESIPADVILQLKKHLLDSVGSLIRAQEGGPIFKMSRMMQQLGEGGPCAVPVLKRLPVDRAAQFFTALIRYPDFMDNYIGKEATCHPSDNIGPLLAAGQLNDASGKEFLTAMGIGYEIECRLVNEIPVMIHGFDHTVLYAYSATAELCKMLKLSPEITAHALGIAGCSFNPLVTCRASYTYEWKGLASSLVALGCTNIVLQAAQGITGPISIFEGPKGFDEVMDMKLEYDWSKEDFSLIRKCCLKSYNAEVHTQASIEAALDLKKQHGFSADEIEHVDITTFLTCYHIVGGGVYGDRKKVFSKEQADHSLPYVLAVALLDGQVYPEQLTNERIKRPDVQDLLRKVNVHTVSPLHKPLPLAGILDPYTAAYPEKLKAKIEIRLAGGKKCKKEVDDYHGFHTRPLSWEDTVEKFRKLTEDHISEQQKEDLISLIREFENHSLADLISALVKPGGK